MSCVNPWRVLCMPRWFVHVMLVSASSLVHKRLHFVHFCVHYPGDSQPNRTRMKTVPLPLLYLCQYSYCFMNGFERMSVCMHSCMYMWPQTHIRTRNTSTIAPFIYLETKVDKGTTLWMGRLSFSTWTQPLNVCVYNGRGVEARVPWRGCPRLHPRLTPSPPFLSPYRRPRRLRYWPDRRLWKYVFCVFLLTARGVTGLFS